MYSSYFKMIWENSEAGESLVVPRIENYFKIKKNIQKVAIFTNASTCKWIKIEINFIFKTVSMTKVFRWYLT